MAAKSIIKIFICELGHVYVHFLVVKSHSKLYRAWGHRVGPGGEVIRRGYDIIFFILITYHICDTVRLYQ